MKLFILYHKTFMSHRFFKNFVVSASILNLPENLLTSIWTLLKAVNSCRMQNIPKYEENARRCFDTWVESVGSFKVMTHNLHLLIAHGGLYLRYVIFTYHKCIFSHIFYLYYYISNIDLHVILYSV